MILPMNPGDHGNIRDGFVRRQFCPLLAERGCTVDVTAYAVREGGKGIIDLGADANLGVLGEDASVRYVMAGGRRRVSDGEVMIYSTNRARIQEPNA